MHTVDNQPWLPSHDLTRRIRKYLSVKRESSSAHRIISQAANGAVQPKQGADLHG
jgi:hypothetical protein